MRLYAKVVYHSQQILHESAVLGGFTFRDDGINHPTIAVYSDVTLKNNIVPKRTTEFMPGFAIDCPKGIYIYLNCPGPIELIVYCRNLKEFKENHF